MFVKQPLKRHKHRRVARIVRARCVRRGEQPPLEARIVKHLFIGELAILVLRRAEKGAQLRVADVFVVDLAIVGAEFLQKRLVAAQKRRAIRAPRIPHE